MVLVSTIRQQRVNLKVYTHIKLSFPEIQCNVGECNVGSSTFSKFDYIFKLFISVGCNILILYMEQSNENRTPATEWQWNLFYSKVIPRSIKTFITLGDEIINSSPVESSSSLMDPQLHPLLVFLLQMKQTSANVFLQVTKNVGVTREKVWDVHRKLIPHQVASVGTGVIMQKNDSVRHQSRAFWLMACRHIKHSLMNENLSL